MSTATELLRRTLRHLEWCDEECCDEPLEEAIRAFLAAEPEAEPVAWDNERADEIVTELYRRFKDWSKRGFTSDDVSWCEVKANINELISLRLKHLHPPNPSPSRKPMMEEEIKAEIKRRGYDLYDGAVFLYGIRFAEKHHGIGGDDPETDFGIIAEKREWQGLTPEEQSHCWASTKGDVLQRLEPFARAIEQALKEQNT